MSNIRILSICIMLLVCGSYASASNTADSLTRILGSATREKRVDILNALGWEQKYNDIEAAFRYSTEAQRLSEQLDYDKGRAKAAMNLAGLYTLTNNDKEAIRYANRGIAFATSVQDTFTLAKLFNIKALALEDQNAYALAIEYFNRSYQYFLKIGNQTEATGLLNNLAVVYGKINENKLEIETYIKVIEQEEKAGNKIGLARTYSNMADVYYRNGKTANALNFYRKSLQLSRETNSARYEAAALNGMGLIKSEMKQYDSAIIYLTQSAELNKKYEYHQWEANNYLNLGGMYLHKLSNPSEGVRYLRDAASIYYSISDWDDYVSSMTELSAWYRDNGDLTRAGEIMTLTGKYEDSIASIEVRRNFCFQKYKYLKQTGKINSALSYLEKVIVLDDSISSTQEMSHAQELQAKYDLTRQEQENDKLRMESSIDEATIKKQWILLLAGILILLMLALIIIITFISNRKIRKANKALQEATRQLKEKANELQLSNESKDKFLSIISHDLKNPIGAILGLSDLLIDETMTLSEEEKKKYIRYINEGCVNTDYLLENLMKWVRSQTGKLEMNPREFDLIQPLEHALALINNAAIHKNIIVSSEIKGETLVYADQEMISTCLINLLTNAVKFTPEQGRITVSLKEETGYYHLAVSDTGVGISQENLNKLFRPDTKSGTLGTANEKGTGLGLLLVKEFIEKNKGKVSVQSKVGSGSTFSLAIPKASVRTVDYALAG